MTRMFCIALLCFFPKMAFAQVSLNDFEIFGLRSQSTVDQVLNSYTDRFQVIENFSISGAGSTGQNRNFSVRFAGPKEVKTLFQLVPNVRTARFSFASSDNRKCSLSLNYGAPFDIACNGSIQNSSVEVVLNSFVRKFGPPARLSRNNASWTCREHTSDRRGRRRSLCQLNVSVSESRRSAGVDVRYSAQLRITRSSTLARDYRDEIARAKRRSVGKSRDGGGAPKL